METRNERDGGYHSRQLSWVYGGGYGGHACGPLVYVVVVFHCPETVVGDAVAVLFPW